MNMKHDIFNKRNAFVMGAGITMLVLLLAAGASALSSNAPAALDTEEQNFLSLINHYRAQNNVGMLSIDAFLQDSADWMSNDMLTTCVAGNYACSHTDSTGRAFDKRLRDFGYPAGVTAAAGENLAWGGGGTLITAQQAFDLWKNSPGHNANMLDGSYTAIGISRDCSGSGCAWVTDFGSQVVKPIETSTPTPTPTPTLTPTSTPTSTPTPTPEPTTPTPTPTPTPTLTPTLKPKLTTPTPTPTLTSTPKPTSTPRQISTPTPTSTPTPEPTLTPTPTSTPTPISASGSISGYVIKDINRNGRRDDGEKGISDWHISMIGISKNGEVIRKEVSTDNDGLYRFDNLPAGRYNIIENLGGSYIPTSSIIINIVLAAGESSTDNNFAVLI